MEWRPVELEVLGVENEHPSPEPILAGLSASPSDLHDAFVSDLPHLAEVRSAHSEILQTVGQSVDEHFEAIQSFQPADVAIGNLGGYREGESLVLPLSGAIQEQVQLEIASHGQTTAIRLSVKGDNGTDLVRTFSLPAGTQLGQAGWRGDDLILDLESN